ncbi:uncharacterized protein BDR25DRAFT_177275, partial [Lindgomyces ingoldianus]
LRPKSKAVSFLLLASLLQTKTPIPGWNAFYDFGFSVCQSLDEEQFLGGTYADMLKTCGRPTVIFEELWKAHEGNTLVDLLNKHGYCALWEKIPTLRRFLAAPLDKRPTVWKLTQFLADQDNTDPFECLRAYGFNLCSQREQVAGLKAIYAKILKKGSPLELQHACDTDNLYEYAVGNGVPIDPRLRRLLRNGYAQRFL